MSVDDEKIFRAIAAELAISDARFPSPFHSAHEGYAVLLEEVDELKVWVWQHQSMALRGFAMRDEAIQVAAMAVRFIRDCCPTLNEPPPTIPVTLVK